MKSGEAKHPFASNYMNQEKPGRASFSGSSVRVLLDRVRGLKRIARARLSGSCARPLAGRVRSP
mgnify:CR=1 FL=1